MFLNYYRLNDQPFGMTPDPGYIFWSHSHREALASLYYGIEAGCGFMTLIAAPGMGKTTLLYHLLDKLRTFARTVYIFQTQCNAREFLRHMMVDLGWDSDEQDVVVLFGKLYEALLAESRANKRFVLVVDEAQNLDNSVLEMVRLLSDFETWRYKLIQVVLVGQRQLATKLASLDLWQLRQRISIVARLKPLNASEVQEYIQHRFKVAGYDGPSLFNPEALALIISASGGVPRVINNLCFNALTLAYAERQPIITASIVRQVISDLDLVLLEGADAGEAFRAAAAAQELSNGTKHVAVSRRPLTSWVANCRSFFVNAMPAPGGPTSRAEMDKPDGKSQSRGGKPATEEPKSSGASERSSLNAETVLE